MMTSIWIIFFILALVQIVLAKLLGARYMRWAVWSIALLVVFVMHWLTREEVAFLRMVWICSVLMAGMKAIVYREWCAALGNMAIRDLSWSRYLIFACLWFGMDPGAFVKRRKVEWRSHAVVGGACLFAGLLSVYLCYLLDVRNIVVLFICLSAGFHFGFLRLLTAWIRFCGFPVRVLFRNPLQMRGFRDFWGKRWNLAYSHMMARAVRKPLMPILGEKGSMFAVFVISGLLHELAITVPVGGGYGLPTLFFIFHGLICLLEKRDAWYMGVLCAVALVLGLPYLFGEKFLNEIILPSRNVMEFLT